MYEIMNIQMFILYLHYTVYYTRLICLSGDIIVDAIEKCKRLDFLNLEGNTLSVDASKAIAKALESKPELKRVLWKDIFTGRMKEEIPKALVINMILFNWIQLIKS